MNRCPTKHIERQAPVYAYAARKPCGCYMATCYAYDDQDTSSTLAEWKANGWKVECYGRTTAKYSQIVDNLGCKHEVTA